MNKRSSPIELLRLIAMLLIIFFHCGQHGNFKTEVPIFDFVSFARLADVVFVLITGYFLVEKQFNIKRLLELIAEVFTYSVCIYLFSIAL